MEDKPLLFSVWASPYEGCEFEIQASFRYRKDAQRYLKQEQEHYPRWLFELRDN